MSLKYDFFFYVGPVHGDQISLKLKSPQVKKLFAEHEAVIDCVVTGDSDKAVEEAEIEWRVNDVGLRSGAKITNGTLSPGPPYSKTNTLTLKDTEWFSSQSVTCSTKKGQKPNPDKIQFHNKSK